MEHSDVSVIQTVRDAKMDRDDWIEWALIIFVLPIFAIGFVILYIIMVATVLISMFIDWIVCTFKKSMI